MTGIVEHRLDLGEREAELAPDEDLLQAREIRARVQPIAGLRALARHQQPDLVVMVKRPHGHAGES